MRKKIFLVLIFAACTTANGQLLTENFNYTSGTTLTDNGWAASVTTSPLLTVNNAGLTYPGSPVSGIGYGCNITGSGQWAHKALSSAISSGSVYASFLVNLTATSASGDYITALGKAIGTVGNEISTRVLAKSTTGGFLLGIGMSSGATVYGTDVLNYGTTYFIVVKYIFNPTAADQISLWINPTLGSTEGTPTISITLGTDVTSINRLYIRQGASGEIDGFQVNQTWSSVTTLPVNLISFHVQQTHGNVLLRWSTASETNNLGFEIQRSSDGVNFENIGFLNSLSATGNSQVKLDYSYLDQQLTNQKQFYRLKQKDIDGNWKYSAIVLVNRDASVDVQIQKIYPNPTHDRVYFTITSEKNRELSMLAIDVSGKIVGRKKVTAIAGSNGFDLSVTHYPAGTYLVKLVDTNNEVLASQKFIKY